MATFLQKVAEELMASQPQWQQTCVVLPSRRAAIFLKKELGKMITEPSWSPTITTIEEFLLDQLNWQTLDQVSLQFKLYEAFTEVNPGAPQSFDEFTQWSSLLLSDFNEIDRYLVDAPDLFGYLADVERIKKWDLKPEGEMSEMLKKYLATWKLLPKVYEAFTKNLAAQGQVYQGMAYRQMAESMEILLPNIKKHFTKIVFAGFSALNTSEEKIFTSLYENGLADFYWDVDAYYFKDTDQEAGDFLRKSKLIKRLQADGKFNWVENNLSNIHRSIKVVEAGGNHLQAVAANQAVLQLANGEFSQVAVAMADENLLPVFLNVLPQEISSVNVTMGLPLHSTPSASFFGVLLKMVQGFANNNRKDGAKKPAYYHQYWDDFLSHPQTAIWLDTPAALAKARHQLRKKNRVYISAKQLNALTGNQLGVSFNSFFDELPHGNWSKVWQHLAKLSEEIHSKSPEHSALPQALYGFYKVFTSLAQLCEQYPYINEATTAIRFYRDILRSETLDLLGEPLSGLQIMGMLETRSLDFEKLVITSLNEGILPKGRSENSLIPFDIKREFDLPTYLEKDAVYAYHFYRLLHRTKEVVLLYSGKPAAIGSNELSRFVVQLQYELQAKSKTTLTKTSYKFKTTLPPTELTVIPKTEAIMERLKEMGENGFSPTSLTNYINDPIDFYNRRVLGLHEEEKVSEEADMPSQGNVAHSLLERYFSKETAEGRKPKSVITSNDPIFALSMEDLRKDVARGLKDVANIEETDRGKNLLVKETIASYLLGFLKAQKAEVEGLEKEGKVLSIVGLEREVETHMEIQRGQKVKLRGSIDRWERIGNTHRIIDFKTGRVEAKDLTIKELEDLRQPNAKSKSLQLLIYAYLAKKTEPEMENLEAGIYALKKMKEGLFSFKVGTGKAADTNIGDELLSDFEGFLKSVLEEIFNPEVPFTEISANFEGDD